MTLKELELRLLITKDKQELYDIAGILNNRPEHVHSDKVTCLGFMEFDYARQHVLCMLQVSKTESRAKGGV